MNKKFEIRVKGDGKAYFGDLSRLGAEEIRSRLSASGWRFGGYTSGLPVVRGGAILPYMARGKRCYLYFDPETGWFMIQPLSADA